MIPPFGLCRGDVLWVRMILSSLHDSPARAAARHGDGLHSHPLAAAAAAPVVVQRIHRSPAPPMTDARIVVCFALPLPPRSEGQAQSFLLCNLSVPLRDHIIMIICSTSFVAPSLSLSCPPPLRFGRAPSAPQPSGFPSLGDAREPSEKARAFCRDRTAPIQPPRFRPASAVEPRTMIAVANKDKSNVRR